MHSLREDQSLKNHLKGNPISIFKVGSKTKGVKIKGRMANLFAFPHYEYGEERFEKLGS